MSSWYDRFVKTWASTGVATDPSDAQANAGFAFLGAAPPTVELFNSMFKWNDQKDTYLYNQMASVFTWGGQTAVETNPNTLRDAIIAKQRTVLTADTIYYIDVTSGNDTTGNGLIATPWKTIQKAYNYIVNKIDVAGFTVTIQMKTAGTYASCILNVPINGALAIIGDVLNPKLYIIKNTAGGACAVSQGVVVTFKGVAFEASGGAAGLNIGLLVARAAVVFYDDVAFGACTDYQMHSSGGAIIFPAKAGAHTTIYAGAAVHAYSTEVGNITMVGVLTTIQSTPAFSTAVILAQLCGVQSLQTWGITSGSCTGTKWNISMNGAVRTDVAGAIIPGSIAGVTATGGQIN